MNIETENLAAHVSLCQQRYAALQYRLDALEINLTKIEKMVVDIHHQMIAINDRNATRWGAAQVSLICLLLTVLGFLLAKHFV
jgi:hypothetical protein